MASLNWETFVDGNGRAIAKAQTKTVKAGARSLPDPHWIAEQVNVLKVVKQIKSAPMFCQTATCMI
jgi:hypothetical protein